MSCSRYVSLIIVPALPSIKVDAILDEWCATGRPKISHFGYNGAICVPSYCQLMTKLRSEAACPLAASFVIIRSEEHTSELQSLMRISYAVFCLKTKTNII